MERDLRAGGCDAALIARVQEAQGAFIHSLLSSPPGDLYDVEVLPAFPYPVSGARPDAAKASCGGATR
jgi:hypothetical protein